MSFPAPETVPHDSPFVLVMTAGPELGRRYPLGNYTMILGRDPNADVAIDDRRVSRQHARIEPENDGSLLLVDNGSSNGLFVNGESTDSHHLALGDRIGLGNSVQLTFTRFGPLDERIVAAQRADAARKALRYAAARSGPLFETILALLDKPGPDTLEAIQSLAEQGIAGTYTLQQIAARRPTNPTRINVDTLFASVIEELGPKVHVDIDAPLSVLGEAPQLVEAFVNLARDGLLLGSVRFRASLFELDPPTARKAWLAPGSYVAISLHDASVKPCRRDLSEPTDPGERDLSVAAGILRAHEGYLSAEVTSNGTLIRAYLPLA